MSEGLYVNLGGKDYCRFCHQPRTVTVGHQVICYAADVYVRSGGLERLALMAAECDKMIERVEKHKQIIEKTIDDDRREKRSRGEKP